MASLREIKTRIASVRSTLKITSAMKMVASAKLHKAQSAIGNKLPYEQKLHRMLAGMLQDDDMQKAMYDVLGFGDHRRHSPVVLQDVSSDLIPSKDEVERVALVVFSSGSSLCGAFNANVIRQFHRLTQELENGGYGKDDVDVYAVGGKIAEAAVKAGFRLAADCSDMADRPDYEKAVSLSETLADSFASGEVAQVIMLYSHFASASSQPVVRENYLPLALHDYDDGADPVDYILEPDPIALVRSLLPKVLRLKMYTVMMDANAAEHAARTLAMQVATDNAEKLIAELTLAYNKGRQQEITSEILDLTASTMV